MSNTNDGLKIAGFLIVLVFLYKMLQKIGLVDDKEDRKADALLSSNALEPKFWRQHFKGTETPTTKNFAMSISKTIYDAKGTFYDTDGQALGAIKKLKSKSQASYIADIFQQYYKRDLADYLDFMNEKQMALAFNYLQNLKAK